MVQLVYLSSRQDASLTGLAAGLARQMEAGSREFIRGLSTEKGSITFQKLATGVVRAIITAKSPSSGYFCAIGTELFGLAIWDNNYIGAKMFGQIGAIDGFDVFAQEYAPEISGQGGYSEIFPASVSAISPSCTISQRRLVPSGSDGLEPYVTLFIMDEIVRFIQPSLIFPYQSTLPIHVPSFAQYTASFYQSALERIVRTFLQYPVKLVDPEGREPDRYELRNLELKEGHMQAYATASTPNIHPNFDTELIQVVGGLSGVASPDGAVYSVYFKNVFSGMQDYNEVHQIRTPDYISSELYIAGANKNETFNLFTGLSYGLDLKTFLEEANEQKVACLVVASNGAALFHFFHWVYTDSAWTKPLGHARVFTSTLYFTTVHSDKTLDTKTLWTIVDDTPSFSHPSLSSWRLPHSNKSYAPAFMTQVREPLPLGFGTGESIAAIEVDGVVIITSNVDVPFSIGGGFYPDGVFVFDIASGIATVINKDYIIPGLVYEVANNQGDLGFKDVRNITPAVGTFGAKSLRAYDFKDKREQDVIISNLINDPARPVGAPLLSLSLVVNTVDTTVRANGVVVDYDITKAIFVRSGGKGLEYSPPKDGGGSIPRISRIIPAP